MSRAVKKIGLIAATPLAVLFLLSGCSNNQSNDNNQQAQMPHAQSGVKSPVYWPNEMDEGDKYARDLLEGKKDEKPEPPVKTSSGLEYQDLEVGFGLSPSINHMAMVHYTGYLADGTKFESSKDKGVPFQFIVGSGKVIKGFEQGIMGMKVGGKRKVIIPPELGYGAEGHGGKIPPNATLTYEISLLSCDR